VSLHLEQAHHHRGEFRKHTKVERTGSAGTIKVLSLTMVGGGVEQHRSTSTWELEAVYCAAKMLCLTEFIAMAGRVITFKEWRELLEKFCLGVRSIGTELDKDHVQVVFDENGSTGVLNLNNGELSIGTKRIAAKDISHKRFLCMMRHAVAVRGKSKRSSALRIVATLKQHCSTQLNSIQVRINASTNNITLINKTTCVLTNKSQPKRNQNKIISLKQMMFAIDWSLNNEDAFRTVELMRSFLHLPALAAHIRACYDSHVGVVLDALNCSRSSAIAISIQ
jgi:hypothetical protein